MRITKIIYFLLPFAFALSLSNCKSSQTTSKKNIQTFAQDSELYLMVRVNKTKEGLRVVTSEKKVNPIKQVSRTDENAPSTGDVFRCDILNAAGEVILFREKTVPFKYPGAENGQDAIVIFFITLMDESAHATVYHQTDIGVWQEVYSTDLQ